MKQTTVTNVSVDGVVQGLGGLHEDRRGGFEGGGWVLPLFENDNEADHLVDEISLLTYPVVIGKGTRLFPDTGPDTALDLADWRVTRKGVTIQVYQPTGRPQYATAPI